MRKTRTYIPVKLVFSTLAAAVALGIAAAPSAAQKLCPAQPGIDAVTVSLAPAVSSDGDRREHIFLSDTLAADLGIRPFDPDGWITFTPGSEVNPQVRVIVESPLIDGRRSSAVFTVAGTFPDPGHRIRVYERLTPGDDDNGELKLFEDAAPQDVDLSQTSGNGDVTGVAARVIAIPVSESTVDEGGTSTWMLHYCEPGQNGSNGFTERAVVETDKRFALLAPHSGAIETKVRDQVDPVLTELDTGWGVDANLWEGSGSWGRSQTFQRWHATSDAIMPESFPALDYLLRQAEFSPGVPFQHVLALHGYGSSQKGIIVGGRADREAKCLVARRIQDELLTWRGDEEEIGFYLHDLEGNIAIPSSGGHTPTSTSAYSGQDTDNIVNRLSPNPQGLPSWGGIQLEQSTAVRTDETDGQGGSGSSVEDHWLRYVVARGVAQAVGELTTGSAPTGVCQQYLP